MRAEVFPLLNLSQDDATCTFLTIDGIKILFDCGINERLELDTYFENKDLLKEVDLILLSHSSYQYSGALPFIIDFLSPKVEIFATIPVARMATNHLYDLILNRGLFSITQLEKNPNMFHIYDKLYRAFDRVKETKFLQKSSSLVKGYEIIIFAYNIGNTLGACAWSVEFNLTNIVYLVSYNHQTENHLEGLNIFDLTKKKIDILITNSNGIKKPEHTPLSIEKDLVDNIDETLKRSGSVIISCSETDRILEVLLVLKKLFDKANMSKEIKFEIRNSLVNYLDIAKNQIEFMSKEVAEILHRDFSNPFESDSSKSDKTKSIDVDIVDLEGLMYPIYREKRVIITNHNHLFYGPLQEYFFEFVQNPKNLLITIESNYDQKSFVKRFQQRHRGPLEVKNDADIYQKCLRYLGKPDLTYDFEGSTNIEEESIISEELMLNSIDIKEERVLEKNDVLFNIKSFPQFNFKENKLQYSEYGQMIEMAAGTWELNDQKVTLENLDERNPHDIKDSVQKNYKFFLEYSKYGSWNRKESLMLSTAAQIKYFPLQGVSDGVSMVNISKRLNPTNLIVINGQFEESKYFEHRLSREAFSKNMFLCYEKRKSVITIEKQILQIDKIDKENMQVKPPCLVQGEIIFTSDDLNKIDSKLAIYSASQTEVGDVNFKEIYEFFKKNDIKLKVSQGTLSFEDKVFIRRTHSNLFPDPKDKKNLTLEGFWSPEYYRVRKVFYEFLKVV